MSQKENKENTMKFQKTRNTGTKISIDVLMFGEGENLDFCRWMDSYVKLKKFTPYANNNVAVQFEDLRQLLSGRALEVFEDSIVAWRAVNNNAAENAACLANGLETLTAEFYSGFSRKTIKDLLKTPKKKNATVKEHLSTFKIHLRCISYLPDGANTDIPLLINMRCLWILCLWNGNKNSLVVNLI